MYKMKKGKNTLKNKSGETVHRAYNVRGGFLNLLQLMMATHAKLLQLAEIKTESRLVSLLNLKLLILLSVLHMRKLLKVMSCI